MRGALVTSPHSLLLKVPHISRGQALAWAGAESRTRAMASRHCHGAQRFSLRGRTDNFEPRQCAAFFSCQSYLVCIQIEKTCEILPQESVQGIRGGEWGVGSGWRGDGREKNVGCRCLRVMCCPSTTSFVKPGILRDG